MRPKMIDSPYAKEILMDPAIKQHMLYCPAACPCCGAERDDFPREADWVINKPILVTHRKLGWSGMYCQVCGFALWIPDDDPLRIVGLWTMFSHGSAKFNNDMAMQAFETINGPSPFDVLQGNVKQTSLDYSRQK